MKPITIEPARQLRGEIDLPGDKSISHRALMLGSLSKGRTVARNILDCDDCDRTAGAFAGMGVAIRKDGDLTVIDGAGLRGLKKPQKPIQVGESGTTMRILAGILAGQGFESVIDGDESLRRRPMKRVVEPLSLMGVDIRAERGEHPPLTIRGGSVRPISYALPVPSAQVKSAILFAGLYAPGVTTVEEPVRSRDHTERMMEYFGAKVTVRDRAVSVEGGGELSGREVEIPGDISSASFFIAGAVLLKGSKITIRRVSVNPTRAGILDILSRMGAKVRIVNRIDAFEPYADIEAESGPTRGVVIEGREIPAIIDELPMLFVLASLSAGQTVIRGAEELRVKETDRIASMKENIEMMGGRMAVTDDAVIIDGVGKLHGGVLKSFGDHRTFMSMAIAALGAKGASTIDDAGCVNKSFPDFFKILDSLKS